MSNELPVLDRSVLMKSLGDDGELIREVLDLFRDTTAEIVQSLLDEVNEGDLEAVRNTAHYLKGSSANIGARALNESMKNIENACGECDLTEIKERVDEAVREYNRLISELDS